jgi:hypothetical protein
MLDVPEPFDQGETIIRGDFHQCENEKDKRKGKNRIN